MYKSDTKIYIYLENLPPAKEKVEPTEYDPEYLEPLRYIIYQFLFLCLFIFSYDPITIYVCIKKTASKEKYKIWFSK